MNRPQICRHCLWITVTIDICALEPVIHSERITLYRMSFAQIFFVASKTFTLIVQDASETHVYKAHTYILLL